MSRTRAGICRNNLPRDMRRMNRLGGDGAFEYHRKRNKQMSHEDVKEVLK
jgi:hypothetical protein